MSEYYRQHPSGIETKRITDHCTFNVGNVIKYCMRYLYKGDPIGDLKKARSYLDFEIAKLEADKGTPTVGKTAEAIRNIRSTDFLEGINKLPELYFRLGFTGLNWDGIKLHGPGYYQPPLSVNPPKAEIGIGIDANQAQYLANELAARGFVGKKP